ncbi:hypothetical protein BH09VER1_BH09VER1_07190 [soil metagenome]
MSIYLGWNIGGTTSSAALVTDGGELLARRSWPSQVERGPQAMLEDFLQQAETLRSASSELVAAGVSIGGPLDPVKGTIHSPPHLPGWDDWPLRDQLSASLGLPVMVEHDAVACLLAEYLWGGLRNKSHAVYLTAGTGCGAGVLLDGRVLRGPAGQSTEVGHLRLTDHGPAVYGKEGSVEAYCSGTGLALLAAQMHFPQPQPVKELVRLSEEGNSRACDVLLVSARRMGQVCAFFSDLFAPQSIVIGSLANYLPAWWMEAVREAWRAETLPRHARAEIRSSALPNRLQDLSPVAACIFRNL